MIPDDAIEPAIREALAQELEAEADTIEPPVSRGVAVGLRRAARIIRGV